jgi:ATP-dependent Clp protease ATP-binding subunit ClpX
MDTTNILFICGGTFVGIEDIVRKRLGRRTMGFGQPASYRSEANAMELLGQVTSEDLIHYGMIPEFVGRLPIAAPLMPLSEEGLIQVLTEPKNALIKQYQTLFEIENCKLEFTEPALRAIAAKAHEKGTGARGLRSIVEDAMLDIMYELPDHGEGFTYRIDEDCIEGRNRCIKMPTPQTKSA